MIKVAGEEACYHLYHSRVITNTERHVVAIALSQAAQAALLAWVPISSRVACARLKGTTVSLTVIAVYASMLDAAEETKDSFNDDLQDAVGRVPTGDMLIVAGDWNARPGPVSATRHILGKFAVGTRCSNGDHLVNFALVSSTHFQHPQRHLVTWFSNDRHQEPNRPHASAVSVGPFRVGLPMGLKPAVNNARIMQATVKCFCGFAFAFDSVDRYSLWRIMTVDGMPPKLSLIKAYYSSTKMKVRACGSVSMPFEICSGVRQG